MIRLLIEKLRFAQSKSVDLAKQSQDIKFTVKQLEIKAKSPEEKKIISKIAKLVDELSRDANRLKHHYKKNS